MQWTHEQQPIINSEADKLLIQAFASTGKTTTLVGYAKHHSEVSALVNELAIASAAWPEHCGMPSQPGSS